MDLERIYREAVGVGPAYREAGASRLPGLHNGPGDAYRHIIGAAEMTRRYGAAMALAALNAHETYQGAGQSDDERKMDQHNNEIGIAIGRRAVTYDEVVTRARAAIDAAIPQGGSGRGGTARWLNQPLGKSDSPDMNWPPDWSQVAPPAESYNSDDERDRHPEYGAPSFSGRPVGSWNEDDVRAVMASDAYRQAGHPAQAETHARVRAWFERAYGNRPVRRDATGRQVDGPLRQPRIDAAGAAGGPVHVRAHSREGGRVDVDAHDRRPPAR
ncbi:DUF6973 domain-containing protein [Shumkonia mesophila]|uniref:DUF6973 domain-containing protein n=1 Tax=Shumkonia mesophila TaxID=2838854 RepID=UPI0029347575|nr:hypothetical protein [Shumkonia mesophila]